MRSHHPNEMPSPIGTILRRIAPPAFTASFAALLVLGHAAGAQSASNGVGPAPRAGHAMASAGRDGGVYLFGGQRDTIPHLVDTLWAWNGTAWRVASNGGPHHRGMQAMAFDSRRGVLVIYGGIGAANSAERAARYSDTWEWNGRVWAEPNVESPGPRDHHAMAYDSARGVMVMYGGQMYDRSYAQGTWTWDGVVWRFVDSTSGPGGLAHHAMAYDSRRERVVMYGGAGQSRRRTSDTWEWDGAKWERVATSGPPPISAGRLAYDAAHGVTVLFGGDRSRNETWTWDGARWTEHAVSGPPARSVHAMAYDVRRQRVVLFGGGGSGGPGLYDSFADVWEWNGAAWERRR